MGDAMSDAEEVSGDSGRPCDLCLKPHHYFKHYCADANALENVRCLLTYMGLDGAAEGKETKFALCPECEVLTQDFAQHHHSLRMCQERLDRCLQEIRETVLNSQRGIGDQSLQDEVFEEGSTSTEAITVQAEKHVFLDQAMEGSTHITANTEKDVVDQVSDPISEDEDVDIESGDPDEETKEDEVTCLGKDEDTSTKDYVFPFGVEKLANGQEKLLHFCSRCKDTVEDPDGHRQLHDTTPSESVAAEETGASHKTVAEKETSAMTDTGARSLNKDSVNGRTKISLMRGVPFKNVKRTYSSKHPAYLQKIGRGLQYNVMQTLFRCTICNMVIPNTGLTIHKRKHGEGRIPCGICDKTFYHRKGRLNHLAKRHPHEPSGSAEANVENRPAPATSGSTSMTQVTPSPSSSRASLSCAMPIPDEPRVNANSCDRRLDMMQFQQGAPKQTTSSSPAQGSDNDRRTSCGLCSKTFSTEYTCTVHRACRHAPEFFRGYKKQSTSVDQFRSIVATVIRQMRREAANRSRAMGVETLTGTKVMLRCRFCRYGTRNSSQWKSHVVRCHGKEVGARLEQFQAGLIRHEIVDLELICHSN